MKSWFVIMSYNVLVVNFFNSIKHKLNNKIEKYIGVFMKISTKVTKKRVAKNLLSALYFIIFQQSLQMLFFVAQNKGRGESKNKLTC